MPVARYSHVPSRSRMRVSPTPRSVTKGWWRARMPSSPSTPGRTTMATSWEYTSPSGVTTSTCSTRSSATGALSASLVAARELPRLLGGLLDAADHEEGLFGQVVALAVDDVLQLPVALQDLLDARGDLVVLVAHGVAGEDARVRVERVDGRVDAFLDDGAREHGGGVEVGEGGRRRRVGEVVGRHVDGLHRGDRAALGGGDALLQLAHLVGQGGLVAHGARHAPEESGDLGTRLHETEDVVDEEQHVLAAHLAEVLRHGEAGQADAQTRAWRLVHLAEDERRLVDDPRLLHLEPEVVDLIAPYV